MKDVRLNNGVMMPAIGFGVYQIPVDETERIVSEVLEMTSPPPRHVKMLLQKYGKMLPVAAKCVFSPTDW